MLHLPLRHYIEFKSSLHSMWFIITSHFHIYTACFHYCKIFWAVENQGGANCLPFGPLEGGEGPLPSVPTRFTLLIIHDSWTINVPESNPLYFYLSPPCPWYLPPFYISPLFYAPFSQFQGSSQYGHYRSTSDFHKWLSSSLSSSSWLLLS